MGIFIQISLAQDQLTEACQRKLVSVCPVDIFKIEGSRLVVRPEQVDECTLCELCLDVAPPQALRIRKLYSDQSLISRGSGT